MRSVRFKYKGTMVQVTKCLKEEFTFDDSVETVKEALVKLNEHYHMQLTQYVKDQVFIVFEKDDEKSKLLGNENDLTATLGINNVLTFYYPFKGG